MYTTCVLSLAASDELLHDSTSATVASTRVPLSPAPRMFRTRPAAFGVLALLSTSITLIMAFLRKASDRRGGCFAPKLLAGDPRALGHGFELGPHHRRMHAPVQ